MVCDLHSVSLKNRRLIATNTKWHVYFDHLADDQGNEVPDYLVLERVSPRPDVISGICVLPIVNGRFLLISSYRHPLKKQMWETPRGFIDAGETPAQAALRELKEETGLCCADSDLIPLGFYAPEASTMAARGALFVATNCTGALAAASDEIGLEALRLFELTEMAQLTATGGIEDAGTLITYYRYRAHLNAGNRA
jgi:ADP-ribose pyrophosphatase